jgi:putative membrane protein
MRMLSLILIGLVAFEHLYFLYLEMFAWTKPATRKAFGLTAEFAEASKSLAANQGLYNGFLSAGLVWSLLQPEAAFAMQLKCFFLGCVIVAALYGAYSVKMRILYLQGGPAILALAAVLLTA